MADREQRAESREHGDAHWQKEELRKAEVRIKN
jgi:hypothetical protein